MVLTLFSSRPKSVYETLTKGSLDSREYQIGESDPSP